MERSHTLAVIRMVMGEENRRHFRNVDSALRQSRLLFPEGKSKIHKQKRTARTDGDGIAA